MDDSCFRERHIDGIGGPSARRFLRFWTSVAVFQSGTVPSDQISERLGCGCEALGGAGVLQHPRHSYCRRKSCARFCRRRGASRCECGRGCDQYADKRPRHAAYQASSLSDVGRVSAFSGHFFDISVTMYQRSPDSHSSPLNGLSMRWYSSLVSRGCAAGSRRLKPKHRM
jgi:hypothetical protein